MDFLPRKLTRPRLESRPQRERLSQFLIPRACFPVNIELTKRFVAAVKRRSREDVAAVDTALARLSGAFGRPHVHSGASVRPIRPPVYELRASRGLRIVFVRYGDTLKVDFVGSHDEVAAYLRNSA